MASKMLARAVLNSSYRYVRHQSSKHPAVTDFHVLGDALEEKIKPKEKATEVTKGEAIVLGEFFDIKENWGKRELNLSKRPGRSWLKEELRLKSNGNLHKLWYVLLKERNMLLTMEHAHKIRHYQMPNPERLDRVKESMENLEAIVHERNDAFLRLETGDSATPPKRTITSFAGFTYQEYTKEHYEPANVTNKKEYEVPMLDQQTYTMQKLWKEKEHMKEQLKLHDDYLMEDLEREENLTLLRGVRRHYDRVEDLPENVVARRKEALRNFQPPEEPC